jgi:hypothetical protein
MEDEVPYKEEEGEEEEAEVSASRASVLEAAAAGDVELLEVRSHMSHYRNALIVNSLVIAQDQVLKHRRFLCVAGCCGGWPLVRRAGQQRGNGFVSNHSSPSPSSP